MNTAQECHSWYSSMHSLRDTKHRSIEKHAEGISSRVATVQERRKVLYARARMQAGSISTIGLNYMSVASR